jgi:hypothetical protein
MAKVTTQTGEMAQRVAPEVLRGFRVYGRETPVKFGELLRGMTAILDQERARAKCGWFTREELLAKALNILRGQKYVECCSPHGWCLTYEGWLSLVSGDAVMPV